MVKLVCNLTLASVFALSLAAAGALLDGPSDVEIERATAADLHDAQLSAQRFERDYRACKRALGPSADLVQIERTGDYVCREVAIEPTPAELLHRYAELAGRKL